MSLISDPEYIIHNLRLNYLRHVDDPYGPRIISISQRHCANPLVAATGLDDPNQWPELNAPSSPKLASYDLKSPNGNSSPHSSSQDGVPNFGATGLRHTETILGPGQSGLAGMRVTGRRATGSVRSRALGLDTSSSPRTPIATLNAPRFRSDSAPTPVTPSTVTSSHIHITSTSPDGSQEFPSPTPRRRGSASTAIGRFPPEGLRSHAPSPSMSQIGHQPVQMQPVRQEHVVQQPALLPPGISFHLPVFARGAEMEARRRERMRARLPPAQITTSAERLAPPIETPELVSRPYRRIAEIETPSTAGPVESPPMSEEEEAAEAEDEEDEEEEEESVSVHDRVQNNTSQPQHDDEFDPPDLLNSNYDSRPVIKSVPSDEISLPSQASMHSMLSTSQSSAFAPPSGYLQVAGLGNRSRLSPVTEFRMDEQRSTKEGEMQEDILGKTGTPPADSFFDIVRPTSPSEQASNAAPVSSSAGPSGTAQPIASPTELRVPALTFADGTSNPIVQPPGMPRIRRKSDLMSPAAIAPPPPPLFVKRAIPPRAQKSALTSLIASQFTPSDNPFTDLYAATSGRAEPSPVTLSLYFPHSGANRRRVLDVIVRRDATVEEVIGFGLWAYWDRDWQPRLDDGLQPEGRSPEGDRQREIKLSTIGWCLKMVEDDGEPDEDLPALERSRPIAKFLFSAYAVCEASEGQILQNEADNAAIIRRPSRLTATRRQNTIGTITASSQTSGGTSVVTSSGITALANAPTGVLGIPSQAVFLKVRMAAPDAPHFSTTIHTTNDTYMAEVLEAVCRKRRLTSSKGWGLMTSDMTIAIPLDRTVSSLENKLDLVLVTRAYLDENGFTKEWKTTDPNASIYQNRLSDPEPKGGNIDFTAGYKKWTVHRKMPVLGRNERTFAIDGDYIHIMADTTTRAFPTTSSTKTSSHHITSVTSCKQSRKVPATVKIAVMKEGAEKRYELEAENAKEAAEIVSSIKGLQKSYQLERSGTGRGAKIRRSRIVA